MFDSIRSWLSGNSAEDEEARRLIEVNASFNSQYGVEAPPRIGNPVYDQRLSIQPPQEYRHSPFPPSSIYRTPSPSHSGYYDDPLRSRPSILNSEYYPPPAERAYESGYGSDEYEDDVDGNCRSWRLPSPSSSKHSPPTERDYDSGLGSDDYDEPREELSRYSSDRPRLAGPPRSRRLELFDDDGYGGSEDDLEYDGDERDYRRDSYESRPVPSRSRARQQRPPMSSSQYRNSASTYSDESLDSQEYDDTPPRQSRRASPLRHFSDSDDDFADDESYLDRRSARRPRPQSRRSRASPISDSYPDTIDDNIDDTLYSGRQSRAQPRQRRGGRLGPSSESRETDSLSSLLETPTPKGRRRKGPVTEQTATSGPRRQTSGKSLTHYGDGKSAEEANDSWEKQNRVSVSQARKHAERLSGERYVPTAEERFPTVHDLSGGGKSILRKTDPNASDLSCEPLPDYRKKVRVGWDIDWSQNLWKKKEVPYGEDRPIGNWAPAPKPTIDRLMQKKATELLRNAGAMSAPTSNMTMEEDFELMHKYDISGLSEEDDPTNSSKIASVMASISADDREELSEELKSFKEWGLIRQKDLDSVGYDLLKHRAALDFWKEKSAKYNAPEYAAQAMKMFYDGHAIITNTEADRDRLLDNGKDIDAYGRPNLHDLVSLEDRVANRDYSSGKYTVPVLSDEDLQRLRQVVNTAYEERYDKSMKQLSQPTSYGGSKPKVTKRHIHKFQQHYPFYTNLPDKSQWDGNFERQLKKTAKQWEKTQYLSQEEFASRFPELSTYENYSEAAEAGRKLGDADLAERWYHDLFYTQQNGVVEVVD